MQIMWMRGNSDAGPQTWFTRYCRNTIMAKTHTHTNPCLQCTLHTVKQRALLSAADCPARSLAQASTQAPAGGTTSSRGGRGSGNSIAGRMDAGPGPAAGPARGADTGSVSTSVVSRDAGVVLAIVSGSLLQRSVFSNAAFFCTQYTE